jgi:hypothetical protein
MIPTHDSNKSENNDFTDNIPIMDGGAFVHKALRLVPEILNPGDVVLLVGQ